MPEIKPSYTPNAKQNDAHECSANEVFFGGAKGGGKSKWLVMDTLQYALQYPKSDPHLFRETYDALEGNLIKEWHDSVPKELYTYNSSKHEAHLINGSVVKFRYVTNETDAAHYDGRSIPYLGVDEMGKHTERTIQRLQSSNRCAKGFPVYFRATGNPGGIGHSFCKSRYVEPTNYGKKIYRDKITGSSIAFFPSTVYDNTAMMENDPNYAKRLENLPEMEREALLKGNWDIWVGQYFTNFGNHLEEQPFNIQAHEAHRVFGSFDYGFGLNGWSCYGQWYLDVNNVPHRLFTWYVKNMTASEQADELLEYIKSFPYTNGIVPKRIWADTAMFAAGGLERGDRSPADYFRDRGLPFEPANKNRLNGAQIMLDYFQPDVLTKQPKLKYWSKHNTSWVNCIKAMVHDEDKPGDVLKCDIDHPYDESRYGLMGLNSNKINVVKVDDEQYGDIYGGSSDSWMG